MNDIILKNGSKYMKKIFVLLALILPLGVIANEIVSLDGLVEPEWKDFAPPAYADVEEPKGLGKLNETVSYWYQRRVDFESSIEACRAMEDNDAKLSCYQEVKVKQYAKNSDYNAKIEAQERAGLGPSEMYDKTNNMLPVGNYLNNFTRFQPNEIR